MKKITPASVVALLLAFVPWTILLVRTHEWALKSPAAEITIGIYSVEIILAFLYCLILYTKKNHKDAMTSIGLVVNGLYAAGVLGIVGISIHGWLERSVDFAPVSFTIRIRISGFSSIGHGRK